MEDKEIIEGNILIAEFMGWHEERLKSSFGNYDIITWEDESGHIIYDGTESKGLQSTDKDYTIPFLWDWNFLMPVVVKIEQDFNVMVVISGYLCDIYKTARNPKIKKNGGFKDILLVSEKHNDKLELVWTAVVKFIKKDFIK